MIAHRDVFQQRLLFHFQRSNARTDAGERLRHGVEAHAHTGTRGVEQVDGFVRQLAAS